MRLLKWVEQAVLPLNKGKLPLELESFGKQQSVNNTPYTPRKLSSDLHPFRALPNACSSK